MIGLIGTEAFGHWEMNPIPWVHEPHSALSTQPVPGSFRAVEPYELLRRVQGRDGKRDVYSPSVYNTKHLYHTETRDVKRNGLILIPSSSTLLPTS